MRALSLGSVALVLAACSTGSSGTTGGSIAGTGGSVGGSTGSACVTKACTANSDCTACGSGYECQTSVSFFCCGSAGTACTSDSQCCSDLCDPNTLVCDAQLVQATTSGTATSGPTAAAASSGISSSTSGGSTATAVSSAASSGSTGGSTITSTGGSTGTTSGSVSTTGTGGSATSAGGSTGAQATTSGGTTSGSLIPAFAFAWTFGASQACEQASVAWVTVEINGAPPVVVAPCRDLNGVEGVTINASAYAGAEASYVVTAYDGVLDSQLGQVSGTVLAPLQGTTPVPVTLPLASGQASALDLNWTFNGLSATQAAIGTVQVQLTDPKNPGQDVNETLDGGPSGVSLPGFGPAVYPVTLIGNGPATYQATGSVAANGLTPAVLLADLPVSASGNTGNVVINFSFSSQSCAAAGLDTVSLQLSRVNGSSFAGPITLPCASAGTSYVLSNVAAPATAFLWLEGLSQGQTLQLASPQIVVSPGATATYTVSAQPAP